MSSNRSDTIIIAGVAGISIFGLYKLLQYFNTPDNKPSKTVPQDQSLEEPENKIEFMPPELDSKSIRNDAQFSSMLFFTPPLELPSRAFMSLVRSDLKNSAIETKNPFLRLESKDIINEEKSIFIDNKHTGIPSESSIPLELNDRSTNELSENKMVSAISQQAPELKTSPSENKVIVLATTSNDKKNLSDDDDKLLEYILCPIYGEIMTDPVTTVLGQTYERSAIEEWFNKGNSTDPITNRQLYNKLLTPNFCIKSIIEQYRQNQLHFIPIDKKMTKNQLFDDIQKTIDILSSLENYANKTGIYALTKHHQPEAKKLLVALRVELDILKCCDQDNRNEQITKIINLLQNSKTKNKKSGFTIALQKVIEEVQKHYPLTDPSMSPSLRVT